MPKRERKRVKRERVPPVLAAEVGLRCRLYRPGTKVTCGKPATCFRSGVGSMCDDHPQARGAIRYATERETDHRTNDNGRVIQHIERRRKPAA